MLYRMLITNQSLTKQKLNYSENDTNELILYEQIVTNIIHNEIFGKPKRKFINYSSHFH